MNEKIKELAEQAGVEFDDDLSLEHEPIYYVNQSELTKFAELIVQECAQQINSLDDALVLYSLADGRAITKAEWLLKHFGIKS